MDISIYNIHYIVGLFGKTKNVEYYPNVERSIDTSGILILEYETLKSVCERLELLMNDGTSTIFNENKYEHRMVSEFLEFAEMIKNNDLGKCYKILVHSLIVSEVQTIVRIKSGIIFTEDNNIK